jgi:uncharacterized protein YceK
MKRFIAGVVACIMILSGCSKVTVEDESQYNNEDTVKSMFVIVEKAANWLVVYNKDTKVMYVVSKNSHSSGIFTLLVNPDGTPMIWED